MGEAGWGGKVDGWGSVRGEGRWVRQGEDGWGAQQVATQNKWSGGGDGLHTTFCSLFCLLSLKSLILVFPPSLCWQFCWTTKLYEWENFHEKSFWNDKHMNGLAGTSAKGNLLYVWDLAWPKSIFNVWLSAPFICQLDMSFGPWHASFHPECHDIWVNLWLNANTWQPALDDCL